MNALKFISASTMSSGADDSVIINVEGEPGDTNMRKIRRRFSGEITSSRNADPLADASYGPSDSVDEVNRASSAAAAESVAIAVEPDDDDGDGDDRRTNPTAQRSRKWRLAAFGKAFEQSSKNRSARPTYADANFNLSAGTGMDLCQSCVSRF